jgi:hypothetical protein
MIGFAMAQNLLSWMREIFADSGEACPRDRSRTWLRPSNPRLGDEGVWWNGQAAETLNKSLLILRPELHTKGRSALFP